jgi:hypothetical protein
VESNNFDPPASTIVMERVFKSWRGAPADEAVVAAEIAKLNKVGGRSGGDWAADSGLEVQGSGPQPQRGCPWRHE